MQVAKIENVITAVQVGAKSAIYCRRTSQPMELYSCICGLAVWVLGQHRSVKTDMSSAILVE